MLRIQRAAVIGAGTMGSAIAAHLANAGIACLLLDIVPKDAEPAQRSHIASDAIKRFAQTQPAPLYDNQDADLISPGNLEDDFDHLKNVDWIIEAVPEVLSIKQSLFKRLNDIHQDGQLISSNTSGIALAQILEGCTDTFKKYAFICHFFNPPRYMHLLELVKGADTDSALFEAFIPFAEQSLGKGVVIAKDTPNFIANRIGAFDMACALQLMQNLGMTVEEVDTLAGPLIGRPKSAICRLLDLVGIDIIGHVNANIYDGAPDDESRDIFDENPLLKRMIDNKLLGDKSGSGFYRKAKDAQGKRLIEALQLEDLSYAPSIKVSDEHLKQAKSKGSPGERIRFLMELDNHHGEFVWQLVSSSLCYAANRIPEIADEVEAVDNAMRWGFNWELGPFELWDAIGIDYICKRLEQEHRPVPALVQQHRQTSFYAAAPGTQDPRLINAHILRSTALFSNVNASLIDLGDDIVALQIHSPNNTLSIDVLASIRQAVDVAEKSYRGLVLTAAGSNFSFGANLKEMMQVVADNGISAVEEMISNFQKTSMMLKHSSVPTVAAATGLALGGGCEFVIHCHRIQSAPELYIGLVEAGVGILPAGGGTKEFAVRAAEWAGNTGNSLFPKINQAMELIGMAQMSSSAADARNKGFLRPGDCLSMNTLFLLHDAKQQALQLANQHYRPAPARPVRVMGKSGISEFQVRLHNMREAGYISEHDQFILNKIAVVLCGGDVPNDSLVSHQHLLDLELQAFLELLGTEKTQQRIEHTMNTGKPLRN